MRKIILTIIAAVSIHTAKAQSEKVVSAWKYLKDYNESRDPDHIAKAKEAIDPASENPETKDQAKTQVYRGEIYLALFKKNLDDEKGKNSDPDPKKKEAAALQVVSATELLTAYDAFAKAKSADVKGIYKTDVNRGINEITVYISNKAVYDYNAKNYGAALNDFEKVYEITGSKDTLTLNSLAITAERAENFEKAKLYYQKMIDAKMRRGSTYIQLMNTHLKLKDTIGAIDVVKKGRAAFPDDINLLRNEIDIYIRANKTAEAIANLEQAIAAQPTDPVLYFARGSIYDHLSNSNDAKPKEPKKMDEANEKMKLAEADYKKAGELKPDYFDAIYNLGALYYNNGVKLANRADAIIVQKEAEAELVKANKEFEKALAILEKAHSLADKDRATMTALKNIYYRLQMKEKGDAMKAKLAN